ncbi:MAG: tetrathionate reductase family octaheme c-type cytochrome [Woeseiaceae bacterium]|nr:tetrathionate reductase family octaheme c-type cytochrome [Gammaproteobacteria bacterium]NNK24868.1 tetrathionate reductase family octaheme c-type cytochrome [Woeseiaceae bacterium]
MTRRNGFFSHAFILLVLSLGLGLAGCEGDDGAAGMDGRDGTDGTDGADGTAGAPGQACWDLNNNSIGDPEEDINGDGVIDVFDCNAYAGGAYEAAQLHSGYFTEYAYEGTGSCLSCHGKLADEFLTTAHWKWEGEAANIEGVAGQMHGKKDILNNFCIGIASNEGRCTQCHAGYGWADETFDFDDPNNIDCLVCHDQTGTYAKAKPAAGMPEGTVDLQAVARSVAMDRPTISNCIDCHAGAGGGDNVKHGDLALSLENTTFEYDVHMGKDGVPKYECVDCHQVKRDGDEKMLSHGIGGMPYHSVDEGIMKQCDDCHLGALTQHAGSSVETVITTEVNGRVAHERLACQVCHIPTFARHTSTKVDWDWSTAGAVVDPIPKDPVTGRDTYDRKKGTFIWANNVRPELRFFNGTWRKMLVGVNDTYESEPAIMAEPVGDFGDPEAMIYPFKKMVGKQPADVVNQRIIVPHLFGTAGGPNPFWGTWDWDLALIEGAAKAGQPYTSGDFGFVSTEMFLTVNHEVAPKEQAYGYDNDCSDCHFDDKVDWAGLGWDGDPVLGGDRIVP